MVLWNVISYFLKHFPAGPVSAKKLSGARQLWNTFRKSVEARQARVFLLDEAAIHHAIRLGRLRLGLRRNDGVVAIQPAFGTIIDVEAVLQPDRDRLRFS